MTNKEESGPIRCVECGRPQSDDVHNDRVLFTDSHAFVEPRESQTVTEGRTLGQYLKQQQGETERLRDLVRFSRHQLLTAGLITGEEYASLAPTADVLPRLVSYDELRAHLNAADAEIRKLIAERDNARAEVLARIRAAGYDTVADALEKVLNELTPGISTE